MIRTALYGTMDESAKFAEILRSNSLCRTAGVYSPRRNEQSTNLIDHPEQVFPSFNSLLDNADCIIFLEPASEVYDKLVIALRRSRHVFIQPDTKLSAEELSNLQKLAEEAGVLLYLRHNKVNSRLKDLVKKYCNRPEYIDSYAYLNTGGKHNPEILKEMLYLEIAFVLSLSQATCRRFFTSSVPYCPEESLLFNVRIEFTNGSAANLTLNNYLSENARFTEVYAKSGMIRIDSKNETIGIVQRSPDFNQAVRLPGLREPEPSEELTAFFKLLGSHVYPADPSTSGIILHQTAMEIIGRLFPVTENKRPMVRG